MLKLNLVKKSLTTSEAETNFLGNIQSCSRHTKFKTKSHCRS